MNRQPGYYWVKYKGNWIVAEWLLNSWWPSCAESDQSWSDDYFDEIDERRIEREPVIYGRDIIDAINRITKPK